MSREDAIKLRHVEANGPHATNLLVVDIDAPDAVLRALWDRKEWMPNWVAENPANGHAHAVWAIATPIVRTEYARRKPLAYGAAVAEGLRRSVDGDTGYSGKLVKNIEHPDWNVYYTADQPYTLDDLHGHLDDLGFMPPRDWRKRAKRDISGLGRNCTLFELLRQEAYPLINKHWGDADGYAKAVENLALQINVDDTFETPLPTREALACARSISKWVTTKSDMWAGGKDASDARFKARQSFRGARSATVRAQQRLERVMEARAIYASCLGKITNKDLAQAVGMSVKWVEANKKTIQGVAV